MREDAPLLEGVFGDDRRPRGGIELTRRFKENVAHEAAEVGLTRQPLEVTADDRVGFGKLRNTLFRCAFTLAAHVVYETFAVHGRTDHTGSRLEGRQFG